MNRKRKGAYLLLSLLAACMLTQAARADALYTFGGYIGSPANTNTFSFTLPALITKDQAFNVSFTLNGTTFTKGSYSQGCFTFGVSTINSNCDAFGASGSLFYVNFSNPSPTTFGSFTGGGSCVGQPCEMANSLVISQVSATTPEPPSLLLLASGALGAAGVLRRRL